MSCGLGNTVFYINVLQLNFHLYLKVLQNVVQCIGINTRLVLTLVLKWFAVICSHTSYQRLINCKYIPIRPMTVHICWIPASWLKPHKRPCKLHGLFCTTNTCYFGCTPTHCKHALSKKNITSGLRILFTTDFWNHLQYQLLASQSRGRSVHGRSFEKFCCLVIWSFKHSPVNSQQVHGNVFWVLASIPTPATSVCN